MTNISVTASNAEPKPATPATPRQQTQGNPKPAGNKPGEQQK